MDIKFFLSIEEVSVGWSEWVQTRPHGGILEYRIGLDGGLACTAAYPSTCLAWTEA